MEKEFFQAAEMELIRFDREDVITTSPVDVDGGESED